MPSCSICILRVFLILYELYYFSFHRILFLRLVLVYRASFFYYSYHYNSNDDHSKKQ